jgi:hypothetical protein
MHDYEEEKNKRYMLMRAISDFGMGAFAILVGIGFIIHRRFGIDLRGWLPGWTDSVFGVLCILYGGWRIYRGYKKNYFK